MSVPGRTGGLTVATTLALIIALGSPDARTGTNAREDLGIDSLSLIDATVAADDGFGLRIPNDDLGMWSVASDTPRSQQEARSQ